MVTTTLTKIFSPTYAEHYMDITYLNHSCYLTFIILQNIQRGYILGGL